MRFPSTRPFNRQHRISQITNEDSADLEQCFHRSPQTSSAGPTNAEPENIEHRTLEQGTRKHRPREGGCQRHATGKMSSVRLFKHFIQLRLLNFIRKQFHRFLPIAAADFILSPFFLVGFLPGLLCPYTHSLLVIISLVTHRSALDTCELCMAL